LGLLGSVFASLKAVFFTQLSAVKGIAVIFGIGFELGLFFGPPDGGFLV
jgi:hypothetical protein